MHTILDQTAPLIGSSNAAETNMAGEVISRVRSWGWMIVRSVVIIALYQRVMAAMVGKKSVVVIRLLAGLCLTLVVLHLCGLLPIPMCFTTTVTPTLYPRLEPGDNINVTVVTAFFNIGTFQKGVNPKNRFSLDIYLRWAKAFSFVQNPVIVFTDCEPVADLFRSRGLFGPRFKVVFISNRNNLFAFQNLARITQVFADPNYPKFHPNTVIAEYSSCQHAKMDVMEKALAWDIFHTEYFAWVDLGYFRDLHFRKRKFWIAVPPEMDVHKIAACEVHTPNWGLKVEDIFKKNEFWVGGGMFLGTREKYAQFVAEYRPAMQYFLGAGLVNTDQQLLYAMFQPSVKKALNVTTELQLFRWPLHALFYECWFYLGFHCYREQ